MTARALEGMRIVETATYIAGPLAGKILLSLGADVIKIENKQSGGCPERTMGQPYLYGEDGYQVSSQNNTLNGGGKRSMTLDYTCPEGREIFKKMIKEADVYIDNNPYGRSEKLGFGWEELHKINPKLIVARVTGYGLEPSAYRDEVAYDPIFEGRAGFMSVTGEPGEKPVKSGVAIGDMSSAIWVALGIMVAYYYRETVSGEGQLVDYAMQDGMLSIMENMVAHYGFTGTPMGKMGGRHPMVGPFNMYECGDGKYVYIVCGNNKQAYALFDAIGHPELKEYPGNDTQNGIVANADVNEKYIREFCETRTMNDVCDFLRTKSVPVGPLYNAEDIFNDPYFFDRKIIVKVNDPHVGEIAVPGSPLAHLSETPAIIDKSVTDLGAHNAEVLKGLGYTDEQIADFEARDVI